MSATGIRLQSVHSRIRAAALAAGRDPQSVRLLAVSKTQAAAAIREAFDAGQRDFGENYVQEAIGKQAELAELPIHWHFIGPIQSNKTRLIASHFDWVHSIDRLSVAERLSAQRPAGKPPLQACIQVNVSGEASKSGCDPAEAAALVRAAARLPGLAVRGLMTIPEPTDDPDRQRAQLESLRTLAQDIVAQGGPALDTLSMGMSDDLEAAIGAGSTMVRIGTAIFGPRAVRTDAPDRASSPGQTLPDSQA
jgi:pyridoxal phosphate enzyme (YggS family)